MRWKHAVPAGRVTQWCWFPDFSPGQAGFGWFSTFKFRGRGVTVDESKKIQTTQPLIWKQFGLPFQFLSFQVWSDFSSHSIFIEIFILAQFFTIRLSLTLCWLANRTMKTIWLKVQLRKILRLNWIFLIWHCHDVYTTKIRDFTKKIRKPYQKKSGILFASRGFSIVLQVLRTFIYPNIHILSDVLQDPPPPNIYIYRGRRIVGPGRPAKIQEFIPKNPENITKKNPGNIAQKSRKCCQKNPENIAQKIQKMLPEKSRKYRPKNPKKNNNKNPEKITTKSRTYYIVHTMRAPCVAVDAVRPGVWMSFTSSVRSDPCRRRFDRRLVTGPCRANCRPLVGLLVGFLVILVQRLPSLCKLSE